MFPRDHTEGCALARHLAAAVLTVYCAAWIVWLMPVLSIELGNYNYQNDWIVRCLQLAGLAAIAAAIWAVWSAVKLVRLPVPVLLRSGRFL